MTVGDVLIDRLIYQADLEDPNLGPREWTEKEDQFVIDNYQFMTNEEIGEAIDRSGDAVKIHVKRILRLPARSKNPDYITAYQAAVMLGLDSHKLSGWVDYGMIPQANIPATPEIRVLRRIDFMIWVINPNNWIYFDIAGVRDPHLKRLLELRAGRWGDEWWTTVQAAAYWNVDNKDVLRYIKTNRLPAIQPKYSVGGRHHERGWKFWFMLRSDVINTKIWSKTNGMKFNLDMEFSPKADEFLVRAVDKLGYNSYEVGRLMKKKRSTIIQRYHQLTNRSLPYRPTKKKRVR